MDAVAITNDNTGRTLTYPFYIWTTASGINATALLGSSDFDYTIQNFSLPLSDLALSIPNVGINKAFTELFLYGAAELYAIGAGSPFYTSARLNFLGNVNGTNNFKVNGAQFNALIFPGVALSLGNQNVENIDIPTSLSCSIDLSALQTTPVFTAAPAALGWAYRGTYQFIVKQTWL